MNKAQKRPTMTKVLSMILALIMVLSLLPLSGFTADNGEASTQASAAVDGYEYNIMFLDCGRKYYSIDSIKSFINNASAAGFNYIQLAVGNDGMRFLLDDMSLTVNGTTYSSDDVKAAIKAGNQTYNETFSLYENRAEDDGQIHSYDPTTNELTQTEMDTIIAYASEKGMGVIPCVNTPGHMDAILSAATSLTDTDCAYNGSARTIDVTNDTAVAFTKAFLQKYIDYFKGKGCELFNMGADEYANDKYTSGSMGFGNLQSTGKYSSYVNYVNEVAAMIKAAGMKPMAFNDGIYFNSNTSSGTFDTDIVICYWSSGWTSYSPMPVSQLVSKGFKVINTNGEYYWVLGKNAKCSAETASGFNVTSFSGNETINNPVGSMFCIWADYPGRISEDEVISGTAATIAAFGAAVKDSVDTNEPETKTITVTVGGTKTVTVDGDYSGSYTTKEPNIATVSTETTTAAKDLNPVTKIESGKQYLLVNTRSGNALTDTVSGSYLKLNGEKAATNTSNLWTITSTGTDNIYTVKSVNNKWLSVGNASAAANTTSVNCMLTYDETYDCWDIADSSGKYHLNHWGNGSSTNAAGYTVGSEKDDGSRWDICEIVGGTVTTITFNGVSEGTTTVTIGGVTYTIKVVEQSLEDVTPLEIQYWITNSRLTGSDDNQSLIINATDNDVATEEGVNTADLVAETGKKDGRTQEYWQTKILEVEKTNNSTSGTELQTTKAGDDETLNGKAFTKVRYWGGAWQVYTTEWINVDREKTSFTYTGNDDVTQTYSGDKNQLVAYYMEVVDIKNENDTTNLHVNAADWGTKGDGTGNWGYTPESNRCSVSIQLVYPDSSTNPEDTTAAELKSKTIVYGYWSGGRGLGTMIFNGQDNYQIIKVTAETGTMVSSAGTDDSVTVTSLTWANNEETVWEGDATDSVSIGNPSKSPSYEAPYDNLAWNTGAYNNNNAILIRVYVKAIPKADALTVNYFVQGENNPFYFYNINVEANTQFDSNFRRVEDSTAVGGAKLINNTVKNYEGNTQTVQWELSKMTEIGAQYRYSDYEFVRAERSEDGKTVNLYYKFNSSKTFVVDFGLPVVIEPKDMNANLGGTGVTITGVDITSHTNHADIKVVDNKNIVYTLNEALSEADNFGAKYSGKIPKTDDNGTVTMQEGDVSYSITIVPASNVYYEDSFATFKNGTGTAANAEWSIQNDAGNTITEKDVNVTNQVLSTLGSKEIYGYDEAYESSTKYSMGSAHKVTVSSAMAEKWTEDSAWPTATFTFKGTGFDIISLTDNTSGTIFVDVYKGDKAEGEAVKSYFVDNYYGYTQVTGENGKVTWVVNKDSTNALYQIPVMKVTDLGYDTYTVVIKAAYSKWFDHTDKQEYTFVLDAIRVYNPMGKDIDTYVQDDEGYPQYIKLRDSIADESAAIDGDTKMVFIDGGNTADIGTYANYGPNNEVYLANGQAISFNVPENAYIASIQIGAKAPSDNAAEMVVNGTNTPISSATEMYYQIGTNDNESFTITNTGTGILSLTNLKITFTTKQSDEVKLAALTEEDQANAVATVRALFAAPTPEVKTFEPERFDASWNKDSVRVGQKATLTVKTSADVEAITVNGETVDNYKTRYERSGWGWWAEKVEYRVFTYTVTATETMDYEVAAVNAEGTASEPVICTLTVKPAQTNWWDDIWNGFFGKWF